MNADGEEKPTTEATGSDPERRFSLRIAASLLERLERVADAHNRSINSEIIWSLRQYVEREERQGSEQ